MDRDLITKRFIPRRVARPAGRPLPVPPVTVVQALLAWCERQGAPGAQLALLALIAARADMIQALRWDEVNDDHLSWSADRMKGARDFDQPLSTAAKAWLDRVPKVHPVYVFPARHGRTEGQIDLSKWTAKSPLAGYRTHDLRAAFATHAQEALGVSPSVIAATLDHSPASMLGVTSRYLKPGPRLLWAERRAALQAWAALLTAPAGDHAVDDAVPLAVAAE
jgi:integrase